MENSLDWGTIARLLREGKLEQQETAHIPWPPTGSPLEGLEITLPYLTIPSSRLAVQKQRRSAQSAMALLLRLLDSLSAHDQDVAARRILECLPNIAWWVKELFLEEIKGTPGVGGDAILTTLMAMFDLSPQLTQALTSRSSVIELVALSLSLGAPTQNLLNITGQAATVVTFLSTYTRNPRSRAVILDFVHSYRPSGPSRLISALVRLCKAVIDFGSSGDNRKAMPDLWSAFGDLINTAFNDPRNGDVLRKGKAFEIFMLYAASTFFIPLCGEPSTAITLDIYHWITKQPRQTRKALLLDFIASDGLWTLLLALQIPGKRDKASSAGMSILGYMSSRTIRKKIRHNFELVKSNATTMPNPWTAQLPFYSTALSRAFEIRLPPREWKPNSDAFVPPFCYNLSHYDTSYLSRYRPKCMTCSRCRAVIYCCKACQVDDWKRVHRYECQNLVKQEKALSRKGLRVSFLSSFYYHFIARRLNSLPAPINETFNGDNMIYVASDLNKVGERDFFDMLFFDTYRELAERHRLWSAIRFETLVDLMKKDGAKLVACVERCMGAELHFLCVYMPRVNGYEFLVGMVQIAE